MLERLNKYYDEGLVQKQLHPTLPLTIWNYTPKVQYGVTGGQYKLWDDITVQCRGLVTDDNGVVVARPFKKFFNIEENRHTSTSDFEVYPNPVTDILNISNNENITNVSVFNLLGQEVFSKTAATNISQIDLSNLSSGAYMVKVATDGFVKTIKIVKQ
jgi:tRNA splicing ligase